MDPEKTECSIDSKDSVAIRLVIYPEACWIKCETCKFKEISNLASSTLYPHVFLAAFAGSSIDCVTVWNKCGATV